MREPDRRGGVQHPSGFGVAGPWQIWKGELRTRVLGQEGSSSCQQGQGISTEGGGSPSVEGEGGASSHRQDVLLASCSVNQAPESIACL